MSATPSPASDGAELAQGSVAHALELIRPLFDAELYAREYRDVQGDAEALLLHFCDRGWKEGRNPHAGFDTLSYLTTYPDVVGVGWNPFYHYVLFGHIEGRMTVPAFMPRATADIVFGRDVGDWVAMLRPEVDEAFYAEQFDPPLDGSFDLVAHFAYRGWQDDRNPNHRFDVHAALSERPDLRDARINPLVALIAERPQVMSLPDEDDGRLATTRFPRDVLFDIRGRLDAIAQALSAGRVDSASSYDDPVERIVADHLDRAYYLANYPDVALHDIDPVAHYCQSGWAEGRNPAVWFDTAYYLRTNADVAYSNVNPFWHYLVGGKTEARAPHRPGGYRRDVIEHAVDPDVRTGSYTRAEPNGLLNRIRVDRLLRAALDVSSGLVLSLSHDCYVRVTGGIQLFIADEQARYARQGLTYLHLSPFVPLLRLADPDAEGTLVNLVIDGRFVGVTSYADVTAALDRIERRPAERRLFLVHCMLGHHVPDVTALQRASSSTANVFWVHDYSSLCLGYTLLRNDATYCHAPPPDSMACGICVYGERRPAHLAQMHMLFEAIPFQVAAPSQAALSIWLQHTALPYVSAVAHAHCEVVATDDPQPAREPEQPVRVAFIGYARAHKGWPIWTELVSRTRRLGAYEFFHLGSPEAIQADSGIRHHVVATSAGQPDAMSDAVKDLAIDLVLVLSTWPETFSYVTYEAFAGGADVVCLADSGNVADAVLRAGRGVVAADEDSLFEFFASLRAVEYVRQCRAQGTPMGQLVRDGTTATLQLVDR